jgi:hypothetical protein
MPPNRTTPTPAQGRGDDQGLGPCGVDGKVEMPSGEVTGSGEIAGDAPSAPSGSVGGKGELPEERPGRTIDVVGVGLGAAVGVGRGDVSAGTAAVGVGRAVAVGKASVAVGKASVGVGRTSVGVGRTSVGVGGTGVGEAESGEVESGDWNQASSAGPPNTARSSPVRSKSSTICTADLRFDTFVLDCQRARQSYERAKRTTVTPVSPSPSAPSRKDSTRG